MYWSSFSINVMDRDRQPFSASIFRTSMDGNDNGALFMKYPFTAAPSGLTLDLDSQSLYWVDTYLDIIGKASTDGSMDTDYFELTNVLSAANIDRATLKNLEYYDGTIYFNERFMHKLYSLRVNPLSNTTEEVLDLNREIGNIRVVDAERRQPLGPSKLFRL